MEGITLHSAVTKLEAWWERAVPRDPKTASRIPALRRHGMSFAQWALPITSWLPGYRLKEQLPGDCVGGLVMGVMFIPMGLAYAALLKIPLSVGLYSAAFYSIVYGFFGGVAALSMGPVAEITLMLMGTPGAPDDPHERASFMQAVALQVAVISLVMTAFQGGAIIRNSFAKAVRDAYAAAAGIILITTQLKDALNVHAPTTILLHEAIKGLIEGLLDAHADETLYSLCLFTFFFAYLYLVKQLPEVPTWIPHQLIVLVVGIVLTWAFQLHDHLGIAIVGDVPSELPQFGLPPLDNISGTFVTSFVVALVSFLQLYGIATKFTTQVDANHELFANSLCALASGFGGGIPGSSSFSRCSVLGDLGVSTPLNSLLAGLVVLVSAVGLTRLGVFYYMPKVALAAIIITSVMKLVDFSHALWLARIFPLDFFVWTVTFLLTLFLGVAPGILSGIALSTVIVLFRVGMPPSSTLGFDAERQLWRALDDGELLVHPEVFVWSFDAPLLFINVSFFTSLLDKAILKAHRSVSIVVICCGRVTDVDASSVESFTTQLANAAKAHKVRIVLADVNTKVEEALLRSPSSPVDPEHLFATTAAAVAYADVYVQQRKRLLAPYPRVPAAAFGAVSVNGASTARRLLGLVGLVSHADRTPKQKLKLRITDPDAVRALFRGHEDKKSVKVAPEDAAFHALRTFLVGQRPAPESTESLMVDALNAARGTPPVETSSPVGEIGSSAFNPAGGPGGKEPAAAAAAAKPHTGSAASMRPVIQLKRVPALPRPSPEGTDSGPDFDVLAIIKWGGLLTHTGYEQAKGFGATFATRLGLGEDAGQRLLVTATSNGEDRVHDTGSAVLQSLCDATGIPPSGVNFGIDESLGDAAPCAKAFAHDCEERNSEVFGPQTPAQARRLWHLAGVAELLLAHRLGTPHEGLHLVSSHIQDLLSAVTVLITNRAATRGSIALAGGESLAMFKRRYALVLSQLAPHLGGDDAPVVLPTRRGSVAELISLRELHPSFLPDPSVAVAAEEVDAFDAAIHHESPRCRVGGFDVSKVTSVYDHVVYDMIHNAPRLAAAVGYDLRPLFALVQSLYVVVASGRHGANPSEKLINGALHAGAFLVRIRAAVKEIITSASSCTEGETEVPAVAPRPPSR